MNVKELTVKINRLERNNPNNYHSEILIEKFSPSQKISAKIAKSKEKPKNYSTNLSTSKINERERKHTKGKETKISSKLIVKNKLTKKTKSPSHKILSTSQNANEISYSNNYNNDCTSRFDKSSRKNSRSNSKSSSRI